MPPKQNVLPRAATMTERLSRLYGVFQGDDRVLIVINADPDAIGSAMALKRLLWRKVASVTIARTNVIKRSDNLTLLEYLKLPIVHVSDVSTGDFSRLAVVDSQPHHFDGLEHLHFDAVIDHHPMGKNQQSEFVDVRPDYGATATMMTEYLQAAKIKPSRKLATALFYGIKTDTNNFARQGLLEDVKAFRFLFPLKHQNIITKIETSDINKASLKFFRTALERVKIRKDTAFVYLGKVDNPDTIVMLADFFMRVRDINRSIAAGVCKDRLVIIFRSSGLRMNAGKTAVDTFGELGSAGGHKSMARAEIALSKLDGKLIEQESAMERFLLRLLRKQEKQKKLKGHACPAESS